MKTAGIIAYFADRGWGFLSAAPLLPRAPFALRSWFHIVAVSLLATACAHVRGTREVAPWLRVEAWRPSDFLFSESGQNHDRYRIDQKIGGAWRTLAEEAGDDCAFSFSSGTRAVISRDLFREDGTSVSLVCQGELRGTPQGDAIDCFESANGLHLVTIRRFDRDGRPVRVRTIVLPDVAPPAPRFVGYSGLDLVFLARYGGGGLCTSLVVRANDRVDELMPPVDCQKAIRAAEMRSNPGIVARQVDTTSCAGY